MFDPDVSLEDWVGIHIDLCNRRNPTSVVEQFAFGLWGESRLPLLATGTQVYVTKSWHQEAASHFTVQLRFVFGTTGVTQLYGTAHVDLDFSESVVFVRAGRRECWVKQLWIGQWKVMNVSTSCYLGTI